MSLQERLFSRTTRARISADLRTLTSALRRYPTKAEYEAQGNFPTKDVLAALGVTNWDDALKHSGCHLVRPQRVNKFRAIRTTTSDGRVFASALEADRYEFLRLCEKAGDISELRLQVPFPLTVNGIEVCTYIADFTYIRNCVRVIEDTKGKPTPLSIVKMKLVEAVYGERVQLIRKHRDHRSAARSSPYRHIEHRRAS